MYSARNDPDPEMFPNPEMIPKSTPKWYRPRNDPQPWNDPQIDPEMIPISLHVDPEMIPI